MYAAEKRNDRCAPSKVNNAVDVGDRVAINIKGNRNTENRIKGKVIYNNNRFFVVHVEKHGVMVYKESFMHRDKIDIKKY